MGLHEGTEEILVVADHRHARAARQLDRVDARISGGAVYLHAILIALLLKMHPRLGQSSKSGMAIPQVKSRLRALVHRDE